MQILEGKALYETRSFTTLLEMLRQSAKLHSDKIAYMFRRRPQAKILTRTYSELVANIEEFGTALGQLGLSKSKIALVGENSYEWVVAYNAAVHGSSVVVPLDKLLPSGEILNLLAKSKSEAFIFTPAFLDIAMEAKDKIPELKHLICLEEVSAKPIDLSDYINDEFHSFTALVNGGARLIAEGDLCFVEADTDVNCMSALLFTSGTTNNAKGVMLSQKNLVSNVLSSVAVLKVDSAERVLSVLPLHHTFEATAGMFVVLYYGVCICFTDGLRYLAQNLVEWRINVMLGVPLLFANIYKRINDKIEKSGKAQLVKAMRPLSRSLAMVGFHANRKMFKSILDGLGGGLNLVVSGAAAMDKEVIQAFLDFGVTFFQGYGLTETSPVLACCNYSNNIPGSIGPPIDKVTIAVDCDTDGAVGEILAKSDSVMLGYYEEPELTKEVIDEDGWFHTGDMGYIDPRGVIFITGRCKNMIVLTNGKKVFPEEIENILENTIPSLSECMVWGESNAREAIDLCVKIRIDSEYSDFWTLDEAERKAWINSYLDEVNAQMPSYKCIKYFLYTDKDLVKTTTLKVKRYEELKRIHAWLEEKQVDMRSADGSYQN